VKALVLIVLNLSLAGLFAFLFTRRRLFTSRQDRRLWLTWLAVAITRVNPVSARTKLIL
jgi:hypothetical protein